MAQKGQWNFARERECYKTEVHCQRMKETLSESTRQCMKRKLQKNSSFKEVEGEEERRRKVNKETREEVSRRTERIGETVVVKSWCVSLVSGDAYEEFSHGEDSDSCGNSFGDLLGDSCGFSDCVPEVSSGVPVSPSASVVVMSGALLSDSDREIVEPKFFPFSKKVSSRLCGESRRHELSWHTGKKHCWHPEGRLFRLRRSKHQRVEGAHRTHCEAGEKRKTQETVPDLQQTRSKRDPGRQYGEMGGAF